MVATESHFLVEIFLLHAHGAVYPATRSELCRRRQADRRPLLRWKHQISHLNWCVPWSDVEPPLPPLSNFRVVPASLWWPVYTVRNTRNWNWNRNWNWSETEPMRRISFNSNVNITSSRTLLQLLALHFNGQRETEITQRFLVCGVNGVCSVNQQSSTTHGRAPLPRPSQGTHHLVSSSSQLSTSSSVSAALLI